MLQHFFDGHTRSAEATDGGRRSLRSLQEFGRFEGYRSPLGAWLSSSRRELPDLLRLLGRAMLDEAPTASLGRLEKARSASAFWSPWTGHA